MKTEWNYTKLAPFYDKRADYSTEALSSLFRIMGLRKSDTVADIGAGTGKLTKPLLHYGLQVKAVEPNDEMRKFGLKNTAGLPVEWSKATGEKSNLGANAVDAFFMGSSFNVVDQDSCLSEAARVLKPKGWFACMWNHRDLEDELQQNIESLIKAEISDYDYGNRRVDPSRTISQSEHFLFPVHLSHRFIVRMSKEEILEAWKSHATLQRQAKDKFLSVVKKIESILERDEIYSIPYKTNIWVSQKVT